MRGLPSPHLCGKFAGDNTGPMPKHKPELAAALKGHSGRSPADCGNPGPRHLDEPEGAHERDELLDLVGAPGELKDEALGGRIDNLGAEGRLLDSL